VSAPELSEEELESLGRAIGEESTYCVLDCEEPGSECHWPQLRRLLDEHAALKRAQCTREERAVLDACAAASIETDCDYEEGSEPARACELGEDCYIYTDDQEAIARAELANRAAKAKRIP
jgi:hypothetical protein